MIAAINTDPKPMPKHMVNTIMKHIAKHTHINMYGRLNLNIIEQQKYDEWWTNYLKRPKRKHPTAMATHAKYATWH